jgi:hypothetical protein
MIVLGGLLVAFFFHLQVFVWLRIQPIDIQQSTTSGYFCLQ